MARRNPSPRSSSKSAPHGGRRPDRGPGSRPPAPPRPPALLLTLFFLSGASGLIYEILFSRVLHLMMGSTVYSVTTVLTAFMAGLAIGAFVGGRRAGDLAHPIRAYAWCELAIGGLALLVPGLLWLMTPLFRLLYAELHGSFWSFSLGSFVLCGLVLLPPAAIMGATLPILTEGLTRRGALVGRAAGLLYAVNTLGAFGGALLSGFVLVPRLGQWGTLAVGVAINVALFAVVVRRYPADDQSFRHEPEESEPASGDPAPSGVILVVGAAYAASGFAAMLYQVGWTRASALALGSSTYTFTLVVSAFIFGLGGGAAVIARWADRFRSPWQVFAILEVLVGASAAAVIPLFGTLPVRAYELIGRYQTSFARLATMEFLSLFALIAGPTLLMGMMFPLAARILERAAAGGTGARAVGLTYAVNTVGTILGAFSMGFILIPWLGVQSSLLLASGLNVAFGALALTVPWPPNGRRIVLGGVAAAVVPVLIWAIPDWNRWILISGPYLLDPQFEERIDPGKSERIEAENQIVFWRDDPNLNVAVVRVGSGYSLKLNGKTDASTFQDMPTQRLLGHLPMLANPQAKNVCVIGMGSGVTAAAVARHPRVERVDQVEISAGVIEAGAYFADVNDNLLENPRVRFIEADARVHMLFSREQYDVITSEVSNPWIAGLGSLYTVDYFRQTRERLKPGGVMCCWIHTYRMSREALLTVFRSFRAAYPDLTVWTSSPGDLIMIGSRDGWSLDLEALGGLIENESVGPELEKLSITDAVDVISHLALAPVDLDRLLEEGSRLNTDNNGWLEYNAPKALYSRDNVLRAPEMLSIRGADELSFELSGPPEVRQTVIAGLPSALSAKRRALEAEDAMEQGELLRSERLARESLAMYGRQQHARYILANHLTLSTEQLVKAGRFDEAIPRLQELAEIYPNFPHLPYRMAEAYLKTERFAPALPWLDRLAEEEPDDPLVLYNRALALMAVGRAAEAVTALERVVAVDPDDAEARLALGNARMMGEDWTGAISDFDEALRIRPVYFEAAYNRANALWARGDLDLAVLGFTELMRRGENLPPLLLSLSALHLQRDDPAEALKLAQQILSMQPDSGQGRLLRGKALLLAGRFAEALEDFGWVIGDAPRSIEAHLGSFEAYTRLGDRPRADEALRRARALNLQITDAYLKSRGLSAPEARGVGDGFDR